MRLIRLELFGFKSFLHKTSFQFGEGVISIVGPNGCGKSNVMDAVIWVLGERGTKSLRVKDMGDVIFHGTDGKRPVNIAEVTLGLMNGDQEYSVKRRIYRDGTNEYYINGKIVRLKDIQDFFLGTGIGVNSYAIVEQGKIDYFIQMKSQERKVVIEETSGITRFEEKKREAASRLVEVKSNLERIDDIYDEVVKSYEKTKMEFERWEKHASLTEALRAVEMQILIDGFRRISKKTGKLEERIGDAEGERQSRLAERSHLSSELVTKDKEIAATDDALRQIEITARGMEKEIEGKLTEIEYLNEEEKRLVNESLALNEEIGAIGQTITECEAEIDRLASSGDEASRDILSLETQGALLKEKIGTLKNEIEQHEGELEEQRMKLFATTSRLTQIKNRMLEVQRAEEEARKRQARREEERDNLEKRQVFLNERHSATTESLNKKRLELSSLEHAMGILDEKIKACARMIDDSKKTVERLKGEKRGREDFLKKLQDHGKRKESAVPARKRLIDIVRIQEGEEKTLEKFFPDEMEYYVLFPEDAASIPEIIDQQHANFIFFPERGIFRLSGEEAEVVFTRVKNIGEAFDRIKKGEEGLFVYNDTCIDSRGVILNGSGGSDIDLKRFRARIRIEKELKELDAALQEGMRSLHGFQQEADSLERDFNKLNTEKTVRHGEADSLERELLVNETEQKAISERLAGFDNEIDFNDTDSAVDIEYLSKEEQLAGKEKQDLESTLFSLRQRMESTKKKGEEITAQWHNCSLETEKKRGFLKTLNDTTERNRSIIEQRAAERRQKYERIGAIEKTLVECRKKIEILEGSHEQIKNALQKYESRSAELKELLGNLHMGKNSVADAINNIDTEIEKARARVDGLEREKAVLQEKQDVIKQRLETVYDIREVPDIALPSQAQMEQQRDLLLGQINALGEVNFRAEKEFEEVKERIVFLEQQKKDLQDSIGSLNKTITKIDSLSKEIFLETFDTVNNAFRRFTGMIFRGGSGYLEFSRDTDGVEMYVQPPGKKVIRMESLSGGEKALISIAFLLSLMDTKPSPFSFLDEIDAPLDDANLASVMEIIKTISKRTQVIFVTHNRITMENSDTIYGVTMEEEGVSKIVSVKL